MRVHIGSVELRSPIIAASGTCGTGAELARVADIAAYGALVLKTVTRSAREGNRPPRIAETPCGMLNSIGLENPGVERFCEHALVEARRLGVPLVASVAGATPEEYAECAGVLDRAGGLVAIELNLSCPNDRNPRGGRSPIAFGQDPRAAAEVVSAAHEASSLPIWAKLTACVADIAEVARACREAGAEAITAVNTLPGMAVDVRLRRSALGAPTGGLSGPALRPVALRCVWEIARTVDIPVIGCGGIDSGEAAAAFLLAGASAVQVGTAALRDPLAGARIARELAGVLAEMGASSVEEIVGTLEAGE